MKISPSILNCDYLELKNDLKKLEKAEVELLHIDVMDGNFVPNISFGVPVIDSIYKHTSLPLDIHLMIDNPRKYIKDFAKYAYYLNIHLEADDNPQETLKQIRALGVKPAITIKPNTSASEVFDLLPLVDMVLVMSVEPGFGGQKFMESSLEKLEALKKEAERQNLSIELEVDGGINMETAKLVKGAGASVIVAGSFLFNSDDIEKTVCNLKNI